MITNKTLQAHESSLEERVNRDNFKDTGNVLFLCLGGRHRGVHLINL